MTGTFGSLNIAKTGLQYQQLVMDTASNNISNVSTEGYVRRSVNGGELGATAVSALWSTSDGHGAGVQAENVQRMTDQLLDTRVRREHASLSSVLTEQASLSRVETAIGEPSATGVASAIADFKSALQDLATNPDKSATRATALAKAATLTQAFHSQAQAFADEKSDLTAATADDIAQVNDDARQLAQLNHAIFVGQASGTDVGTLLDQRDQVALDLANRAGAVSTPQSDGTLAVTINGQPLVSGDSSNILAPATVAGTPAALTFKMTHADSSPLTNADGSPVAGADPLAITSGELGGIAAAYTTLSTYSDQLDTVAATLAVQVNGVQTTGRDAVGATGKAFFAASSDPADTTPITASNITVSIPSGDKIAAGAVPTDPTAGPDSDGSNADAMYKAIDVDNLYQSYVTGLGAQISGLNSSVTTQQAMATQADDAREQQAGVNLDEETVNMVAAQHAYEASSRVLTVMDSILDTLINHTGVTA